MVSNLDYTLLKKGLVLDSASLVDVVFVYFTLSLKWIRMLSAIA